MSRPSPNKIRKILEQLEQSLPGSLPHSTVQLKLGTHIAEGYLQTKQQQHCPFSGCPENCSLHSGILLTFKISRYLHHHAAGDPQDIPLKEFSFLANHAACIDMDLVRELKEGDAVALGWLRKGILHDAADTYEEETDVRILKKIGNQPAIDLLEGEEEQNLLDNWGIVISSRDNRGNPTCLVVTEAHCFHS